MTRVHDAILAWRLSVATPRRPLWFVLHDSLPLAWPRTDDRLQRSSASCKLLCASCSADEGKQRAVLVLHLCVLITAVALVLRITKWLHKPRTLTGHMPAKMPHSKGTDQDGRHLPSIDVLFGDDTVWPVSSVSSRSRAKRVRTCVRRRRSRGGERASQCAAEKPPGLVRSRSLSRSTSSGSMLPDHAQMVAVRSPDPSSDVAAVHHASGMTDRADGDTQMAVVEVSDTQMAVVDVPHRSSAVDTIRPAALVASLAADVSNSPSPKPVPMATADLRVSRADQKGEGAAVHGSSPRPTPRPVSASPHTLPTNGQPALCECIPSTRGRHQHHARLNRVRHLVTALGPPPRSQRARLQVIPTQPPRSQPSATKPRIAASGAISHAGPLAVGVARGGGTARAHDGRLCHAFIASDRDKSGALSKRECYHALALVGLHYTPAEHLRLWQRCHLNLGGQVEWYEFRALGAALLNQSAAISSK